MKKRDANGCNTNNPIYIKYHDYEWRVPLHDDAKLFEMLLLECVQAGLSWECVLNKPPAFFRRAFSNFYYNAIAIYDSKKIEELLNNHDIIRNRRKIEAAVANANTYIVRKQKYKELQL